MSENNAGTGNNNLSDSTGTQGNIQPEALGASSLIGKPEILAHAANPAAFSRRGDRVDKGHKDK